MRVRRAILITLLDALVLLVLSALLDSFVLDGTGSALLAAALVGILNALVWPALARLALPLNVLTLGLGGLVLNALLVGVVINLLPDARIRGIVDPIVITIVLAGTTAVVNYAFAIDDDEWWYRQVVRRQARRRGEVTESDVPGLLLLEIDGLAHDVLLRAMRDGSAPTMARWLRSGSHELRRWETDWSSQTGACQAGILHGSNDDMPAFRWWEKETGRPIVTNHPRDAAELERRHSDGRGLLHADGASRANILSGDAPHSMLTMSTALTRRRPLGRDYGAYFARPYAVARTLVLAVADIARERRAARGQVRDDVRPRIARGRSYALMRAWATVVQRDLQVATVIGDVLAGRPCIYTTFLAYDEVAHHSGIERPDALAVLHDLDRQIARIATACADAPRPYRLVVLSDHGQSQGETFRDRYGLTLEDLVRGSCDAGRVFAAIGGDDDALSYIGAGLTEVARDDTVAGRTVRVATRGQVAGGAVMLDQEGRREVAPAGDGELPELSVMASGCLGLVSFPRLPGRVTLERIEALYPDLIPALREHPGIGFVMVCSTADGALAIGPAGVHHLDAERVVGEDPLAPFGPNAARHLRRTDSFPHCADLMINSAYWARFDEVAAFEELVGSHGGLGGTQCFPLVLHPGELAWPAEEVIGAESIHRILRGWLAALGHSSYGPPASGPLSAAAAVDGGV
ncbi:MAG TPA: phage holin family protein [Solirubrobacterales bacterium]|nr:phage holin family protein [Solirubrobacterales bacterium]